jgi:hypothetical protein
MIKSDKIEAVGSALLHLQGAIEPVRKDAQNPFLKNRYASLEAVWETARPALQAAGLAVVQIPEDGGPDAVRITTLLIHAASGQYIGGTLTVPVAAEKGKSGAQVVGSGVSYARRYGLLALLGITHDDDDGNAAGGSSSPASTQAPTKPTGPDPGIVRAVQEELYGLFLAAGVAKPDAVKRVQYFGDNVDLLNAKIDEIKSNGGKLQ